MLSFEILDDGKKIQIYFDQDGMATMLEAFASLIRDGDHIHLWGKSGGGSKLSEVTPFGNAAVGEVVIDFNAI